MRIDDQDLVEFSNSFLSIIFSTASSNVSYYSSFSLICYYCAFDKVSGLIFIVHSIDVVIWVNKADLIHFSFILCKHGFGRTWAWCVNIIFEVFGTFPMFIIVMDYLFSWCLFIDKQWTSETACFQFTVIMHKWLYHLLAVKAKCKTACF